MKSRYPSQRIAWIQIIISGLIGAGFYIGINVYLSDVVTLPEMVIQGGFFFTAWILIQAYLNRKRFAKR